MDLDPSSSSEPDPISSKSRRSLLDLKNFLYAFFQLLPTWLFAGFRQLPKSDPQIYSSIWSELEFSLWERDEISTHGLLLEDVAVLRNLCVRINGTTLQKGQTFQLSRQAGIKMSADVLRNESRGWSKFVSALRDACAQADISLSSQPARFPFDRDVVFTADEAAVYVETWMTPRELIVRLKSDRSNPKVKTRYSRPRVAGLQIGDQAPLPASATYDAHFKTAALLDGYVPEFDTYLSGELIDLYLLPISSKWLTKYRWHIPQAALVKTVVWSALRRAIAMFKARRSGGREAETRLKTTEALAKAYMRLLPNDVEHIITSQDFLPYLWKEGALYGRSFDVLMTRPSLSVVRAKLEEAAWLMPKVNELKEFRAPKWIVANESEALVYAERVITPHEEFAKIYPNLRKLEWQTPVVQRPADVPRPRAILFPTSLSAREGAHAVLAASDELGVPLYVVGSDPEELTTESDLVSFVSRSEIPWHEIAAVVHPTLFESWPRLHLEALALDIPVIATEGVGLEEGDGVSIVSFGDEDGVKRTLERVLDKAGLRPSDTPRDSRRDPVSISGRENRSRTPARTLSDHP